MINIISGIMMVFYGSSLMIIPIIISNSSVVLNNLIIGSYMIKQECETTTNNHISIC